jgi:hypothetical protein
MGWKGIHLRDARVTAAASKNAGGSPDSLSVAIPSRSVNFRVAAFPVLLGAGLTVSLWLAAQSAVLGVLLGWGDLGRDASGQRLALTYAVASVVVAAVAIGAGVALCAGLLEAHGAAVAVVRWVAGAQAAVLTAVPVGLGVTAASPSVLAVGSVLAGALVGTLGGLAAGARARRGWS